MTIRLDHKRLSSLLAVGLLLFLCSFLTPRQVSAIPLSDYQKHLQGALVALDALSQFDEDETRSNYQHALTETLTAVRVTLPEKESIEADGTSVTVDNTWLHKRLDDLEVVSESDGIVIRKQLIESLKAIENRVVQLQNAKTAAISKADANARLAAILTRSEYTSSKAQEGSALTRLLRRFVRWILEFLPTPAPLESGKAGPFTKIAQIFVIGLALAVITYVVIKLIKHFGGRVRTPKTKKKREPRIVLGERLEPDASATDLLSEAETLARQGELRAAIRKAYIALLVELGDRKVISLAQYKTNRDYLRSVRSLPSLHKNMTGLTDSFERHWYGFEQTSNSDWQNFKSAYLVALRAND